MFWGRNGKNENFPHCNRPNSRYPPSLGEQKMKFAKWDWSRSRLTRWRLIFLAKSSFRVRQDLRHYCMLWGHLRSVATASKEVTMISSTHNLPLSSLLWNVLYFLLSRVIKLDSYFLHWQLLLLACPLKIIIWSVQSRTHETRIYSCWDTCVLKSVISWLR